LRKINLILIIFILSVGISFIGFWKILQTQTVAQAISSRASAYISKYVSSDISFDRVSFNLFPPGINLHDVSFRSDFGKIKELEFDFSQVSLNVSPIDLVSRKLTISEFKITNGVVKINSEKLTEDHFKKDDSIFSYLVEKIKNLPASDDPEWLKKIKELPSAEVISQSLRQAFPVIIQSLTLENILITRNQDKINIRKFEVFVESSNIDLFFNLENINLSPITNSYFKEYLNELSGGLRYFQNNLKINSLTLKSGLSSFVGHGFLHEMQKDFSKIKPNVEYRTLLSLTKVSEYSTIHDVLGVTNGAGELNGKYKGTLFYPQISTHAHLYDFQSKLADAKDVQADLTFDRQTIKILKGELHSNQQFLKLDQSFELYNFAKDRMVATPILATFRNIPTRNMLKSIDSFMYPLNGELSGRLEISHNAPVFIFKSLNPLEFRQFSLVFGNPNEKNRLKLLSHPFLKLNDSLFKYAYEDNRFFVTTKLQGNSTNLKLDGYVDSKEVNIHSSESQLNLSDLKEIAGLKIAGKSNLRMDILGDLEDVHFIFRGPVENFEFLNYKLGTLDTVIDFGLKDLDLKLNKTIGHFKDTEYEVQGGIDLKSMMMGFDIDVRKSSYNDVLEILNPLLGGLWFMPKEITGELNSKLKIDGEATPDKMKINGSLKSKRLVFENENFKTINFNFNYENNLFQMTNINIFKEIGLYRGSFSFDRLTEDFWIDGNVEQISLDEFSVIRGSPVLLNGNLWGHIEGGRKNKQIDFKGSLNLKNSSVNNYRMDNSKFVFTIDENILIYEMFLLGKSIHSNGEIFLESNSSNRSKMNIETNVEDPKGLFMALFGKYLSIESMDGVIKSKSHLEFDTKNFENLTLQTDFDNSTIYLNNKRYSIQENQSRISINNGVIEKLIVKATGPGTLLRVDGKGSFRDDYSLIGEFNFDASIFESLIKGMMGSNGRLFNNFKISKKSNVFDFDVASKTDDLFIHHEKIPTILNRIKYNIYADEERINIEKFEANLNSGLFKLLGDINISSSKPKINLTYVIEDGSFNYLGKTNVTLSGRGDLTGDKYPYLLTGELGIVNANILNELDDFGSNDSIKDENLKFLPLKKGTSLSDTFRFDLNFETINPIYIKNSLTDFSLVGNVILKGTTATPRLGGRLSAVPGTSRFFFKSNDFILSRGVITFFEDESQINPDLDFFASSTIAEYAINMRIFGRAKNFNLELNSEPSLSQVDILSLITLGYTNELTSNLGTAERNAVTSAGIGGLIFDRFKINEGLKSSFGLKLSLSPEFREGGAGGNMLKGRGSTNTGSTGVNIRSGTKVELRKKVSESVDLAVSSTVGSNIGSKQSMNLNYNINKNVGAEGVYEIRTNDEGIEDVVATSLGGDLKFKWSFK
jgi:translocation and assembly module TamB